MYRVSVLFICLLFLNSCTPQTQQFAINTGTKATMDCLEQVVIYGLNNQGLKTCLQAGSVVITTALLEEVQTILVGWSNANIKILADNIGVESQRAFNRWQSVNGILQNLRVVNVQPSFTYF